MITLKRQPAIFPRGPLSTLNQERIDNFIQKKGGSPPLSGGPEIDWKEHKKRYYE
jgi:hypothetical protein